MANETQAKVEVPAKKTPRSKDARAGTSTAKSGKVAKGNPQQTGFDLNIRFEGLCLFVPGTDRDLMRVLLVNACSGHSDMSHAGGAATSPHVPYIKVSLDDIQPPKKSGAPLSPSRKVTSPEDTDWWSLISPLPVEELGGPSAIRFLRWRDIAILPETEPDLYIHGGRTPGSQEPDAKGDTSHDFSWVPEIERAATGSGDLDPRCFDRDPPRELVIARMRLTTGTIEVEKLVEANGATVIWEFRGCNGNSCGYSQALASKVLYTRHIDKDTVTLRLKPFRRHGKSVDLVLRPSDPATPVVDLEIGNLPLPEILSVQLDDFPMDSSNLHFTMLYRLSRQAPADPPVPVPISHPQEPTGLQGSRGGTMICYTASASPHGLA